MNPIYRKYLSAKIVGALDEAKAAREVEHNGVVGSLREIVLEQLIRPLLSADLDVTSGVVTSHNGDQTGQCDLIIYDRASIPAVWRGATGVVPIEATLAVIEVKTELTAAGLENAHERARQVRALPIVAGHHHPDGRPRSHVVSYPLVCVFAYGTNLTSSASDLDRYLQRVPVAPREKEGGISLLCVVGRGFWNHGPIPERMRRGAKHPPAPRWGWTTWPMSTLHDEVIGFLSVLINTLPDMAAERGRPRLGSYLV